MRETVLNFEDKTTQPWFFLISNYRQVLNSFKTNPLNIIFPQGHNYISTVCLWSTDGCVFSLFWAKVHLQENTAKAFKYILVTILAN